MNKNILLIEPGYKNKYPPLGLMKIAQYHGPQGKRDHVTFIKLMNKGDEKRAMTKSWDRVYVTSLFSFEWKTIAAAIDFALKVVNGQADKVFVGGIAASLMHEQFLAEPRWRGVRIIKGLLDKAPATSLQLDDFAEELYSDDVTGRPIEDLIPDYSILEQIDWDYSVKDAYFAYASRGCIRTCSFCGVPKLEGGLRDTESISAIVNGIKDLYGEKKDLIFMDNNVVASPRFREIIAEVRSLGFEKGAKIRRGRTMVLRRVDFNQGVDARILCKDPMYLNELATICIKPLRIAFDHLGLKKPYEQAVRFAAQAGINDLSNYMLYNFNDSPADLFERMRLNVALNEELGIRIFSFPMRYQPTNLPHRSHVGKNWNRYNLRSMQMILQATHGIVSGNPDFFKRAFGDTYQDFDRLLLLPHRFIFNRDWYELGGGKSELDEYDALMSKLSDSERTDLIELLASNEAGQHHEALASAASMSVRKLHEFYKPIPKHEERKIWDAQRQLREAADVVNEVPEDERVEDAGLEYEEELLSTQMVEATV